MEPCENLELRVNDKIISRITFVKECDLIEIAFQKEVEVGGFQLLISEDKLRASLILRNSYEVEMKLKDQKPAVNLKLDIEKKYSRKEWPFSFDEFIESISKSGLLGVKYEEIRNYFISQEEGTYIIAEGIPPSKTIYEFVEVLIPKPSVETDNKGLRD